MDAMEFCKQLDRICKSHWTCESCLLGNGKCSIRYIGRNGESVVKTVEQWAKDHPAKTRQSEFLKMFPNTKLDTDGVIAIRPCDIDSKCCTDDDYLRKCGACAGDYWLTEVTDNGND